MKHARRNEIKAELYGDDKWIVINRGELDDRQVGLFIELADTYLSEDIYDYPKTMAICHYVKKILETKLTGDKVVDKEQIEKKLLGVEAKIESIEGKFLTLVSRDSAKSRSIESHKHKLYRLRNDIKAMLESTHNLGIGENGLIEEELRQRAQEVEAIYMYLREGLIGQEGVLKDLLQDCIEELGEIPTVYENTDQARKVKYCILGMGSIALGTTTPWSDFEHSILIESGLSAEEERKVKFFFKEMTLLMYIKIVNFGETILPAMSISALNDYHSADGIDRWFYDIVMPRGLSFDGEMPKACKSPLGRQGFKEHKDFELICTAEELARFQENEYFKDDQELVQALWYVIPVTGNAELAEEYQDHLSKYQESLKGRAYEMLKKNAEGLNPNKQLDHKKEGTMLDVKKEIYRFPDRMVVGLADCLGGVGNSSWEIIRNLGEQGKLSGEGVANLCVALSIAAEMRLRTYASNNGQKENLSAIARYELKLEGIEKDKLTEQIFYLEDPSMLYRYYYTVLAVALVITDKTEISLIGKELQEARLYTEDPQIKGQVYRRFLKYYEAIEEFEKVKDKDTILTSLGLLYEQVGRYGGNFYK